MIYIGSDHAGFDLKSEIINFVKNDLKMDIEDLGSFSKDSVDYPDYAVEVCKKVIKNNSLGILICSTGSASVYRQIELRALDVLYVLKNILHQWQENITMQMYLLLEARLLV